MDDKTMTKGDYKWETDETGSSPVDSPEVQTSPPSLPQDEKDDDEAWARDQAEDPDTRPVLSDPVPAAVEPTTSPSPLAKSAGESEPEGDYGDFFEDDDDPGGELFARKDVEKMGIVGGKGVGKSYLFQAMVYRTYSGGHSGALTYFLEKDSIHLYSALRRKDRASRVNPRKFIKNYSRWARLLPTQQLDQKWYRLRLRYRTGIFGQKQSAMDVEYFDGSGEGFFEAVRTAKNRQLWSDGYLHARVMVFCLPLWAAFPGPDLTPADWERRDLVLEGFEEVVGNYADLRDENGCTHPVTTILALTMADSRRGALETLRDRWITPYIEDPYYYLKKLRKGSGVARYLANARKVSEALHEEFDAVRDPGVAAVPRKLDFGRGRPWLIPLSAVDGSFLDHMEGSQADMPQSLPAPVPVHVELPLLVALCERHNALL